MIRNLLLSGGPGPEHDFAATAEALAGVLGSRGETNADRAPSVDGHSVDRELIDREMIETTIVMDPHAAFEQLDAAARDGAGFDLLTVNALRWRMDAERYAARRGDFAFSLGNSDLDAVEAHLGRGGGLLAVHTAAICFDADARWHAMLGASWNWQRSSHPPLGLVDVHVADAGREHPITSATSNFTVDDEIYTDLDTDPSCVALLTARPGRCVHSCNGATAETHGGTEDNVGGAPVLWAREHGGGRVVTHLLGHGVASITNAHHALLIRSAAVWAASGTSRGSSSRPQKK